MARVGGRWPGQLHRYVLLQSTGSSFMKRYTILLLLLCGGAVAQDPPAGLPRIADPVKFDEYGDIMFRDEKARLDNAAIQLSHEKGYILYLVIYAGKTSCVSEAR